ncbi:MAG: DMT family transporter [Defluviitaleaceae bacterium]|nr:DMT family transporter [Defluviitaleaceae bacterium]
MIAINGALTGQFGIYTATIIIHIAGLLVIGAVVLFKRDRIFTRGGAWYWYLGGMVGVFTTVSNNVAFGRISVSALLALGLLGQSVSGLVIDQFGLFGMQKHSFEKQKIIGLLLVVAGIASMINNFEILAMVVSFAAGVTIVTSRTLNARLSAATNVRTSTFYNYVVGLFCAILAFLLLGRGEIAFVEVLPLSASWYMYFGGMLGVCVVLLLNVTVVKISAFYLTLLIFIGQIFSGVLVDAFLDGEVSIRIIVGGVLVGLGMCANLIVDNRKATAAK